MATRIGIATRDFPPNIKRQFSALKNFLKNKKLSIDIISPYKISSLRNLDIKDTKKERDRLIKKRKHKINLLKNCLTYVNKFRPNALMNFSASATKQILFTKWISGYSHLIARYSGEFLKNRKWEKSIPRKIKHKLTWKSIALSTLKSAEKIVCLGPVGKAKLKARGFNPSQIEIIPPFIDIEKFHPIENKLKYRKKVNLPQTKKIILFVGRLSKEKGAHILEKIIRKVENEWNDILFCLIGQGKYRRKLEKYENVMTRGLVDFRKIDNYYKTADLLILTSLTEGLPNVVLESLACRLPVVATNVGEIPWLVSNICSTPQEFTRFILSGEWKVDELPPLFEPKNIAQQYIKLFKSF
ncbi:hypothetical protein AKJ54_00465 [candidate division MSBL1 archaeon SCGC-AAA382K21]|uniref:Glycosyl transferase family 1 domain-containing protein n=1 Tax=candidate division MSBL1 archaeon SCGC-AAA382K21 TaxID=1698283 RepID=A0A133VLD1_9EURY|nr:hypothetical protein AKJ54_00465 [candidate division MSBL1 archaeon SCGC-AAA382K21]